MLSQDLKNKCVTITGGGTGIGYEMTKLFCENNAKVIIASRNMDHLRPTEKEFKNLGYDISSYQLDITKPEDVERFAQNIDENYNGVDVLINNAGGNFICSTRKLSTNGWLSVININLNGTFFCSKFLGETMIKHRRGGSVINLVATYGWTGAPGNIHSAASKAGVIAITKTLAAEWAQYNIRVNAIAPGPISTPIATKQLKFAENSVMSNLIKDIPLRRLGLPEEIARTAYYLASPYWSSYVTGAVIIVDGGHILYQGIDPSTYLEQTNEGFQFDV